MKYPPLPDIFFKENRSKLTAKLKPGSVALVFSGYQMPRNGDQYYSYRQQSDFFYLTGIEQEKSILLIASDAPTGDLKEILFILKSNPLLEIWEGHKLTPEEASNISGINTVKTTEEFPQVLHMLIPTVENIYFNLPELQKFIPEVLPKDHHMALEIKGKYPLHNYERLAPLLLDLRLKKSATELDLMKKAIAITEEAFLHVLQSLRPGMKEYEIEALITYIFLKNGAEGHAYSPIIANGKNACYLHYTKNNDICAAGDLLLMDFGAEYANYAADLSRTIPVSGKFSDRQRELYHSLLRVLHYAKEQMKPGTTINKFHAEVCMFWEEEHIKLGLYTRNDVLNHKGENPLWYKYYMHGTSHFLGLDVHDTGNKDIVFEPGMVLTCEPGIYIAEEGVGIRIENNILITEEGHTDLMDKIPVEPDVLENLMHL